MFFIPNTNMWGGTPFDLGTPVLYLDAKDDSSFNLDGSDVLAWYDLSESQNHFTPLYPDRVPQRIDADSVEFTDTNKQLRSSHRGANAAYRDTNQFTAVYVLAHYVPQSANIVAHSAVWSSPSGEQQYLRIFDKRPATSIPVAGAFFYPAGQWIWDNIRYVIAIRYDGNYLYLQYNDEVYVVRNPGSSYSFSGLSEERVGGRSNTNADYWVGHICSVILYNEFLSDSKTKELMAYFKKRFNVTY